jgi:hypothetical protein
MRILAALTLLAVLVWVGFTEKQGWGLSSFIVLVALFVGVGLVAIARHKALKGQLRWDGEQWYWTDAQDHAVRTMVCILDLQGVMLLQIACDHGKSHWIWLESGYKPTQWKALRRAIVAGTGTPHSEGVPEPLDG